MTNRINDVIKNVKVKLLHIGHSRKARCLGPPADSPDSKFDYEGKKVTVAQYFEIMAKGAYRAALPNGRLRFPHAPTINVGNEKKPVLVPAELVSIPQGQCRMGCVVGDMTAKLIRSVPLSLPPVPVSMSVSVTEDCGSVCLGV